MPGRSGLFSGGEFFSIGRKGMIPIALSVEEKSFESSRKISGMC